MKTIQMTLDEQLLAEVDRVVRELDTNRSALLRQALRHALRRLEIAKMEQKQIAGYTRHPVEPGEFDVWLDEQHWHESA